MKTVAYTALVFLGVVWSAEVNAQQDQRILTETLRLGAIEGDQSLSSVGPVALFDELIAIGQPQDGKVLIFDARTGELVRSLGSRGRGPGEFLGIRSVSIRRDTVVVIDAQQSRVVRFDLVTGEHIETEPIIPATDSVTGRILFPIVPTTEGPFYWASPIVDMGSIARGVVRELPVAIVTREGKVQRYVFSRDIGGTVSTVTDGRRVLHFIQPLVRPSVAGYAADGSRAVLSELAVNPAEGAVRIAQFDHRGNVLFDRQYRIRQIPVTPAVRDSLGDWLDNILAAGNSGAATSGGRQHLVMPSHHPLVSQIVVAGDGTSWIRTAPRPGESQRWLILGQDGSIIGNALIPGGVDIQAVSSLRACGFETDTLGVPFLVCYKPTE